jgi:tetratricopeptide (TPR) repeat protein
MNGLLKSLAVTCLLLACAASAAAQHKHAAGGFSPCSDQVVASKLIAGLPRVNHPVSTERPEAQDYFNQGLTLVYAFNHEEAARSFRRAAQIDDRLAMAHWGIALAVGPNINIDIDPTCEALAFKEMQEALRLARLYPPKRGDDLLYINALAKRYSGLPSPDRKRLSINYAVAMSGVAAQLTKDPDAKTLYAESLMDLRPWRLWDDCGRPAGDTHIIVNLIEQVLADYPQHIGANHYKIHALEASTRPGDAKPSADLLKTLVPAAGHLIHMSSHIYARVGDYAGAAAANENAVLVDKEYVKGCEGSIEAKTCLPIYVGHYYSHNLLFLAVARGMQGKSQEAQSAAEQAAANATRYIKQQPSLEHFLPAPVMMLARFHRWDDMLKVPEQGDKSLHITRAMRHWGRGMAYATPTKHDPASAEVELGRFLTEARATPAGMPWGNNDASAMYPIAEYLLRGHIAMMRGDAGVSIEYIKLALDAQAALVYDEPDPWFVPVREHLGSALLQAGRHAEAETVFRKDLRLIPNNGRSLFGLAESLKAQGKTREAERVRAEFESAWKNADTRLRLEDL